MSILQKLFSKNVAVTSETIRSEITKAQAEAATLRAKIEGEMDGLAAMTDDQHVVAEATVASLRRSIARLESRIAALDSELPAVIEAETAAAAAATEAALIKRAEAARKANDKEAAKLLATYADHANAIADILTRLDEIAAETDAVNAKLRSNPVAEGVESYNMIHRSTPGTAATERKAIRKCWVYRYPGSPRDTEKMKFQYEAPREEVIEARIGDDGRPTPMATVVHRYYDRELIISPTLEDREVVVGRTTARPTQYAPTLNDVRLPPANFGSYIWPRA